MDQLHPSREKLFLSAHPRFIKSLEEPGGDGRDIDLLGDLAYRSLYPFQGCTTVSTVGSLHHDDAVWVRIAFSMMTQMSLLSTGFLATLFPLTSRSLDQVL